MVSAYGPKRVPHWMAYYGKLLTHCRAQDARLE